MRGFFNPSAARSDEPGRRGERLWDFLDRSAWSRSEEARDQITSFLDRVPVANRGQFLARLRSADEREVFAAHSELFVHALMQASGFQCQIDPVTPGGSNTDIRLHTGTHLEVHRSSLSDADQALKQRRREILRGLDNVRSPEFWLSVQMTAPGAPPSVSKIRWQIEDWLASLDWNTELAAMEQAPAVYRAPARAWATRDGSITLQAMPKSVAERGSAVSVGIVAGGPMLTDGFKTLQDNVGRKRRQHPSLVEPLIVVLDLTEGISHRDEVAAALYGPVVDYVDAQPRYQRRDRSRGVWPTGRTPRRPAAVMTVDHLVLRDAEFADVTLWLAPDEPNPLGPGAWVTVSLDATGEDLVVADAAVPLAQLL